MFEISKENFYILEKKIKKGEGLTNAEALKLNTQEMKHNWRWDFESQKDSSLHNRE